MPTIAAVEKQIHDREGFRVKLIPLDPKVKSLPAYEFTAMAPQRWRISEWKNERLAAYRTLVRSAVVYRGDGEELRSDIQLGRLRDTYFEAQYPSAKEQPTAVRGPNVIDIKAPKRKRPYG
jgi:hypothetical protein